MEVESSISKPNPTDSSFMIKLNLLLEAKKEKAPIKPQSLKSKSKKVASDNPETAGSNKRKRATRTGFDDLYENIEDRFTVMERAGVVLENLGAKSPSFVKCMLPSNVDYGFWLIFPKKFCNLHLPNHDATVILVNELGDEYKTKFLLDRHGLSAGWRRFSIGHRLIKGDLLVFQLVGPCKLKVHTVRVHGLDVVDAAICVMNLAAGAKRTDSDHVNKGSRTQKKAKKCAEPLPSDITQSQESIQKNSTRSSNTDLGLVAERSENNSDGYGSEVLAEHEKSNNYGGNEVCCCQRSHSCDHHFNSIQCRSVLQEFIS